MIKEEGVVQMKIPFLKFTFISSICLINTYQFLGEKNYFYLQNVMKTIVLAKAVLLHTKENIMECFS